MVFGMMTLEQLDSFTVGVGIEGIGITPEYEAFWSQLEWVQSSSVGGETKGFCTLEATGIVAAFSNWSKLEDFDMSTT